VGHVRGERSGGAARYEAFNERDADEAVKLVSPGFSFQSEFDALSGRRYQGRAGFRDYFRFMVTLPDGVSLEAVAMERPIESTR
jgi:hypothetical protein